MTHESIPSTALPLMGAEEVVRIALLTETHGIFLCVDGGWAVDALLGWQTRPHKDLDVALNHHDLPMLLDLLGERGYHRIPSPGEWEHNFVLADDLGHQVDLHSFIIDAKGEVVGGVAYPPESLTGKGTIQGQTVNCIDPRWLVDFHSGYPLDAEDFHDVRLLCDRFGFALPVEFLKFETDTD